MMYKVIRHFTDMQDNNFAYNVGDEYPRKGFNVSQNRIKELSSNKNRRGVALIKEFEDAPKKKKNSAEKAEE